MGELMYADWRQDDLFSVLLATCYLLHRLQEVQPQSRIVVIVNTELKPAITDGLIAACDHYGIEKVVMTALDKLNGHPGTIGMTQIKDRLLEIESE